MIETTKQAALVKEIKVCRACGKGNLRLVLDLGNHAVSDFYTAIPADELRAPLVLLQCEDCGLVQLSHSVDRDRLYQDYWYRSGINESMVAALKDVVDDVLTRVDVQAGDNVVDIGANDGTLLDFYPKGIKTHGYEPSHLWMDALKKGHSMYLGYFPPPGKVPFAPFKVMTSIACFYDLDDPNAFVAAIKDSLADDGVWVNQMMDLDGMLAMNAFDNICHEHVAYWTTAQVSGLLGKAGLEIIWAERNKVNGGSVRLIAQHQPEGASYFNVKAFRYLDSFAENVSLLKDETLALLEELRCEGKTVLGYGASTKGNTLLQYYGITPDLLPAIAERNPEKVGKVTAGQHIPIISEAEMRERKPDYLFCLPWHFLEGMLVREQALRDQGTRFIVPLPNLRVV